MFKMMTLHARYNDVHVCAHVKSLNGEPGELGSGQILRIYCCRSHQATENNYFGFNDASAIKL